MRILSRLSFLVAISFASLLLIEAVDYPPLRDALHVPYPASPNPQILRIGFIGDTGVNIQAERNLLWLKNRANVDAIVHVGDFAYELDGAAKFREMTEGTLGDKFPYFTVSGDHDLYEFDDYRDFFVGRDLKTPGADCRGVWGVKSVCRFKGLVMIGVGLALKEADDYETFLHDQLERHADWPWKVCVWHRNAEHMQVGAKNDGIDAYFYDICREHGAFIVTGHQHTYSRTHSMTNYEDLTQNPDFSQMDPNHVNLEPGKSFTIVTGLSGSNPRYWISKHMSQSHWAAVVARQNMAGFGNLVCEFEMVPSNPGTKSYDGFCKYEDLSGFVHDSFTIKSSPRPVGVIRRSYNRVLTKVETKKEQFWWYAATGAAHSVWGRTLQEAASYRWKKTLAEALGEEEDIVEEKLADQLSDFVFPVSIKVELVFQDQLPYLKFDAPFPADRIARVRLQFTGSRLRRSYDLDNSEYQEHPKKFSLILYKALGSRQTFTSEESFSSKKPVEWEFKLSSVQEAHNRAVWISPDLKKLLSGVKEDEECLIPVLGDTVYGREFLVNAFASTARLAPSVVFEIIKTDI